MTGPGFDNDGDGSGSTISARAAGNSSELDARGVLYAQLGRGCRIRADKGTTNGGGCSRDGRATEENRRLHTAQGEVEEAAEGGEGTERGVGPEPSEIVPDHWQVRTG